MINRSDLWSELEFQRVAINTRLGESSLNACREVLVKGELGTDVAVRYSIFASQLSRSLGVLRDKQAEMAENFSELIDDRVKLKTMINQVAKAVIGKKVLIIDAEPGKIYIGALVANVSGFVVQKSGLTAIVHDLGRFENVPPLHSMLTIQYPKDRGKVVVSGGALELGIERRGTGVDRRGGGSEGVSR